jgi:phosphoglucosamine mutase
VAATVTSNGALFSALGEIGVRVAVTPVGDKEVLARMKHENISLGAESSGHVIDSDIFEAGDGTATALSVLSVISDTGEPLSSLASGFSPFPSVSCAVMTKDKESVLLSDGVQEAKRRAEALIGDEGRLLLRASGTENKIRILAECSDLETCKMATELIEKAIISAQE